MTGIIVEYGPALSTLWVYDLLSKVRFSTTYKGTKKRERHLGGIVVTERKISYQILIDLDIQIKAKRNPSIKGLLQIFLLHMTEVSVGWD